MLFVCHPKFCISIVFSFSWGFVNSQEKLKTMLMQNFGVTNKEHYGMLWYFLEWSISSNVPRFSQLFPHIYKLCIFSFPRKRPAPVTARTPYSRPKGVLTPELALYFFIGIAKEYILGVHSTSISAVKTKNGGGTFLSLWSWTALSPQEIKRNYSFADLALHELARDTQV